MDDLPPEFLTAEFAARVGGMKRYFMLVDRWYARQAPANDQPYQSRDDGAFPSQQDKGFWYRQMKRGAGATAVGGVLITRYRDTPSAIDTNDSASTDVVMGWMRR